MESIKIISETKRQEAGSRASIRTQLLLESEQEQEMVEMAMRLSLSENNDIETILARSLQEEEPPHAQLDAGRRDSIEFASLRTQMFLDQLRDTEMLDLALERSAAKLTMPDEEKEEEPMVDPLEANLFRCSATSTASHRTQQVLNQLREEEMLQLALDRSKESNNRPSDDITWQQDLIIEPTIKVQSLSQHQEDNFDIMQVVRQRSRDDDADDQVPALTSMPGVKDQEDEMLQMAIRISLGGSTAMGYDYGKQAAGLTTAAIPAIATTNTVSRNETSCSKDDDFHVMQVVQERARRATMEAQQRTRRSDKEDEKEDDFHVMQVVQERARRASLESRSTRSSRASRSKSPVPQRTSSYNGAKKQMGPSSGPRQPGAYMATPGEALQRTRTPLYDEVLGFSVEKRNGRRRAK